MIEQVFKKMCEIRYFELEIINAHKSGLVKCPVYLSIGQESIASVISERFPKHYVFPQHRGHAWYLAYGGDPVALRDEILGRESGCCRGKGGSSDIGCDMVEAHHGLIGENVPIGVGYALATQRPIVIQVGDGSVDEDCFLPSLGFAKTHRLPVLFICEDNGLAILTPINVRRSWDIVDVVKGFGMNAVQSTDDPKELMSIDIQLPMFINIKTTRSYWHVGVGQDTIPATDRISEYLNLERGIEIEAEAKKKMQKIWQL